MVIQIYCGDAEEHPVLETLVFPLTDVHAYIGLVEKYGYEDADGFQYKFKSAQVEYPARVLIYVESKE